MAVEVLEALVEQLPALRAELWSAIGRLFLQARTSGRPLALNPVHALCHPALAP